MTVHLRKALEALSEKTGLTESQLLLRWALDCTQGVIVTSTSKKSRAEDAVKVLDIAPLEASIRNTIEQAALEDGYSEQRVSARLLRVTPSYLSSASQCYTHPHMQKA